jgi:hypothetical protein
MCDVIFGQPWFCILVDISLVFATLILILPISCLKKKLFSFHISQSAYFGKFSKNITKERNEETNHNNQGSFNRIEYADVFFIIN